MNEDEIRFLDGLCARAWAPLEWEDADGWVLRAASGCSLRANSVWPHETRGDASLDARIENAEVFYRARGLRPHFQLSPAVAPPDLEAALHAHGYETHTTTDVMVAAVMGAQSGAVVLEARATADWQQVILASADDLDDARGRLAIIERISLPCRHALARIDGEPAAIGLGVLEHGWLGIYAMRTAAPFRRRGLARDVVTALLGWAASQGATRAYLQVETDNTAAIALYQGLGFEPAYGYRYCSRSAGRSWSEAR